MLVIGMFFALFVLVNLMASLWWWIAVIHGLENSWVEPVALAKPELNLYDASDGTRWLTSAYFAIVTSKYRVILALDPDTILTELSTLFLFCSDYYWVW